MLLIHNLHVEQAEVLQQLLSIIAKRADDLSMVEKTISLDPSLYVSSTTTRRLDLARSIVLAESYIRHGMGWGAGAAWKLADGAVRAATPKA
jgi:hypothetical protein